ncbi:SDR family NAD(P)-dependent oxidoreductase [Niabella ginsenosidivorans]|uniref:SDR family NAD(P)-dependent oxidoreductase n=1 Tax=Niabella ginsenosidivorans TaxID=1176587 RepID=UPI001C54CE85|nr:SDR family NAD(P)-dependent oxidoreductase [Niabella ginsenosidivorans]
MALQNKKIIVTGGSSGIGLATAQMLKKAGTLVTVTGRNKEKLNKAKTAGLSTAQMDSSNTKALETFFASQGTIAHLIAVSGAKRQGSF